MLFKFIQKMHQRPLHERRRVAFWSAFFITLFIACIWGITLLIRSSTTERAHTVEAPDSPFEVIWQSIEKGIGSFKDFFPKETSE